MQRNILEYLEHTVQRLPDKVAFTDQWSELTFRQLSDQARSIGTWLSRQGIRDKGVLIYMGKSVRTVAAFLGVLYGGCHYVPVDEQIPRPRIEQILDCAQPALVICDAATEVLAGEFLPQEKIVTYGDLAFGPIDPEALQDIRDRQIDLDPAYIVFTSGSTGMPKGVIGSHRSVIDYIEAFCQVLRFGEDTVFGNQAPLYFDACLKDLIPTLKYGATTHLIPRQLFLFPVKLVNYLNEHRVNTLCWVVSALTFLSSLKTFDHVLPQYVRTVAFAGEVFPMRQLHIWQAALPDARFLNLYGPTETTGICCYYEVDRILPETEPLPIGRPFPNTRILLLDDHDHPAPPGQPGEICICGSRLTLGYCGDPQRTLDAFPTNPANPLYPERIYRTGDLGRYNAKGELLFLGRKDLQIKHMGHRIEPGEIEATALQCDDVRSACCVFPHEKLTLFYTGAIDPGHLCAFLRQRLPNYMLPQSIRKLDAMPLTPNGKIDRTALIKKEN